MIISITDFDFILVPIKLEIAKVKVYWDCYYMACAIYSKSTETFDCKAFVEIDWKVKIRKMAFGEMTTRGNI